MNLIFARQGIYFPLELISLHLKINFLKTYHFYLKFLTGIDKVLSKFQVTT